MKLIDWAVVGISMLIFIAGFTYLSGLQKEPIQPVEVYEQVQTNVTLRLSGLSPRELKHFGDIIEDEEYITLGIIAENRSGQLFYKGRALKIGQSLQIETPDAIFNGRVQP